MAQYYKISDTRLKGFADQARRLADLTGELTPEQIEDTLSGIEAGITEEEAEAMVNEAIGKLKLQSKTVTPTDAEQTITADDGYFGLASVIVEAAEGGGQSLFGSVLTDRIENNIVSVIERIMPGGILEDVTPPLPAGTYYNYVKLPEIPADIVSACPYLMILKNSDGIFYSYGSTSKPYYTVESSVEKLKLPTGRYRAKHDVENDVWGEVDSSTSSAYCNLSTTFTLVWSNHDIPNGSADATDIYFKGTDPLVIEEG